MARGSLRLSFLCLVASLGMAPAAASAQWTFEHESMYDACDERFRWDFGHVEGRGDGTVIDGTCDAFDGCMRLYVNGQPFPDVAYTSAYEGRGLSTDTVRISSARVTRNAYVPEAGHSFARWLDLFENVGAVHATLTVRYECDLGTDRRESGFGSDGDSWAEPSDTWIASDDADGAGSPSLAFVVQGEGSELGIRRWLSEPGSGAVSWEYVLGLAPGETRGLVVFLVQTAERETSYDAARSLEALSDEATTGLTDWVAPNFLPPGAPVLHLGAPYVVGEGMTLALEARVRDPGGEMVDVVWDLDGDGAYETPGTHVVFDASALDGPVAPTPQIGARATDGVQTTERRGVIEVVNVAPALTNRPNERVLAGGTYVASLGSLMEDPCEADEISYVLVEGGPPGLTIDEVGELRWETTAADVGIHHATVLVSDDDGGETRVELRIRVRSNAPPARPRLVRPQEEEEVGILRPELLFGNATDPDSDPLTYVVRIWPEVTPPVAEDPCLGATPGLELAASAPVRGDPSGNTPWRTPLLAAGARYLWRVTASDSVEESHSTCRRFKVDERAIDGDPSDVGTEPAGCACRSSASAAGRATSMKITGLVVALGLIRGRRKRGK